VDKRPISDYTKGQVITFLWKDREITGVIWRNPVAGESQLRVLLLNNPTIYRVTVDLASVKTAEAFMLSEAVIEAIYNNSYTFDDLY
jgi:hypothetical protein